MTTITMRTIQNEALPKWTNCDARADCATFRSPSNRVVSRRTRSFSSRAAPISRKSFSITIANTQCPFDSKTSRRTPSTSCSSLPTRRAFASPNRTSIRFSTPPTCFNSTASKTPAFVFSSRDSDRIIAFACGRSHDRTDAAISFKVRVKKTFSSQLSSALCFYFQYLVTWSKHRYTR